MVDETMAALHLYQDHLYPQFAQLSLTATPVAGQITLDAHLHIAPAWFEGAGVRVQIALAAVAIVLDWPTDTANQTLEAIAPTQTQGHRYTWRLACPEGAWQHTQRLAIATHAQPEFTARLQTQLADCTLLATTGAFPYDWSPNRQTILERALLKQLWQDELAVALSRVSTAPLPPAPNLDWSRYLVVRDRLVQSRSEKFVELAQMAELDLRRDFVGAKLVGVILSEADLSGVNFQGANLRGAELCDVDLRDANLCRANLRGADFSGALMENANLSQADGQHTSFALANLAGADLRAANLYAANLTNTTWTSAKVTGLQLGQNMGLSPGQQTALLERGAICHATP